MRVIGLTGGIASGKSTVARMFSEIGIPVVDADQLARDVVQPGCPALAEIVEAFGEQMLLADGTLDRKALGSLVFADPAARARLNAITHPRIAQTAQSMLAAYAAEGHPMVLYEAALIVENGLHRAMQGLILVTVPEEMQLERLRLRDGLDEDSARARLAAQLPLRDKLAAANYVIDNSQSLDSTRAQVLELYQKLMEEPR